MREESYSRALLPLSVSSLWVCKEIPLTLFAPLKTQRYLFLDNLSGILDFLYLPFLGVETSGVSPRIVLWPFFFHLRNALFVFFPRLSLPSPRARFPFILSFTTQT